MAKDRHPNFKKASNLIFITVTLLFAKLFFNQRELVFGTSDERVFETFQRLALVMIGFTLVLGILVRFGMGWVKFILMVLIFWDLFGVLGALLGITTKPITSSLYLVAFGLEVWTMVLLFQIPKPPKPVQVPKRTVHSSPNVPPR